MENEYINIRVLAQNLALTRQNLAYHEKMGRFGEVKKAGDGLTDQLLITPENALQFLSWLKIYGRSVNFTALKELQQLYETTIASRTSARV